MPQAHEPLGTRRIRHDVKPSIFVTENMDSAERCKRPIRECEDRVSLRHIGHDREGVGACRLQLLFHLHQRPLLDIRQDELHALLGQLCSDALANPAGRPSDHRDSVGELVHGSLSPFSAADLRNA
jgi:hypothetical protein